MFPGGGVLCWKTDTTFPAGLQRHLKHLCLCKKTAVKCVLSTLRLFSHILATSEYFFLSLTQNKNILCLSACVKCSCE